MKHPMKNNKKRPSRDQAGFWSKYKAVTDKIGRVLGTIGKVLYHLRKLFLSIPVVLAALLVFVEAKERLPQEVGILMQETGTFQYVVSRDTAMGCCMVVTAACLLMMLISRKTIYPWIISLFSLVLPVLLIVTNIFPG